MAKGEPRKGEQCCDGYAQTTPRPYGRAVAIADRNCSSFFPQLTPNGLASIKQLAKEFAVASTSIDPDSASLTRASYSLKKSYQFMVTAAQILLLLDLLKS